MTAKRIVIKRSEEPRRVPRRVVVRRKTTPPRGTENWHPEQALLSAILRTKNHVLPIDRGVNEEWFHAFDEEWGFLERYIIRHRGVPSRTVFSRKFPDFEILRTDDLDYFIDEAKTAHARHELLTTMEIITDGIRDGVDIYKLVRKAELKLVTLHSQVDGYSNQADVIDDWEQAYREVQARVARVKDQGQSGISTGFPTLDALTGGPGPGEYWVVGARLGHGKSWNLVSQACHALIDGATVQFDALEMGRTQVHMRAHNLLSSKFGRQVFRANDLMRGKGFDVLKYRDFLESLRSNLKGHLFVDDTPRGKLSPMAIAAQIEKNSPNIVYIDYLTLMNTATGDWGAVANLSAELKGLAQRYAVPVVAAAQINRTGVGSEPPNAEHLSGSDAIGQDVDALITQKKHSDRVYRMKLAKYRHGPDGQMWWTKLDLKTGTFEEISGNEAQALIEEDREQDDED